MINQEPKPSTGACEHETRFLKCFKPEFRDKNKILLNQKMPFGKHQGKSLFQILKYEPYYFFGIVKAETNGTLREGIMRAFAVARSIQGDDRDARVYSSLSKWEGCEV